MSEINPEIIAYNKALSPVDKAIAGVLAKEITSELAEEENKMV